MKYWVSLFVAGIFEVGWALGMKSSAGFSKPLESAATVVLMIASFWFLSLALRTIPLGTAYAIWTGIGAAGTAAMGIILFGESREPLRLMCIGLILLGVLGLKLLSNSTQS